MAAVDGQVNVLVWAVTLPSPLLPSQEAVNTAARRGHAAVLEWAVALSTPIRPSLAALKEGMATNIPSFLLSAVVVAILEWYDMGG